MDPDPLDYLIGGGCAIIGVACFVALAAIGMAQASEITHLKAQLEAYCDNP